MFISPNPFSELTRSTWKMSVLSGPSRECVIQTNVLSANAQIMRFQLSGKSINKNMKFLTMLWTVRVRNVQELVVNGVLKRSMTANVSMLI